ncbi:MAG: mechanosensitive ion channel [Muribaculaceae bacterium]|nr:mechanosensitive ion channel [Muribaculaceae bacterium]
MILNVILSQIENMVGALAQAQATNESTSDLASEVKHFDWGGLLDGIANRFADFALRLVAAIVVFYIGRLIIRRLHKIVKAIMLRRDVDRSLGTFLLSLMKITLMFILIVSVIGILGIETSSFIALFASAGVAIGMALSGTLQNFAGGVLILLIKPYKVGDYIEFGEYKGFVKEIQIFHTIITSYNNERIIIPNGGLSTGTVNNYSAEQYRRIEWHVSIAYGGDVTKAREIVMGILKKDSRIVKKYIADGELIATTTQDNQADADSGKKRGFWKRIFGCHKIKERADEWRNAQITAINERVPKKDCTPQVYVESLGESAVNLIVRAWAKTSNYWVALYEVYEKIYEQFPANGLNFPFPQLDVTLKNVAEKGLPLGEK